MLVPTTADAASQQEVGYVGTPDEHTNETAASKVTRAADGADE
jgi:hypothetical protein